MSVSGPSWHADLTSRRPITSSFSSVVEIPFNFGMCKATQKWQRCVPNASETSAPPPKPPSSNGFDDCRLAAFSTQLWLPKRLNGIASHGPFVRSNALSFPTDGCPIRTFAGSKQHSPHIRIYTTCPPNTVSPVGLLST